MAVCVTPCAMLHHAARFFVKKKIPYVLVRESPTMGPPAA